MITQFTEHRLFPTTVYQNHLPVDQDEFKMVLDMPFERMPSNNGTYTKEKNILSLLPNTRKQIQEHVHYYLHTVLEIVDRYDFYFTTSWVNKHDRGDYAHSHFHANSVVSGVYYLKTPPFGGGICFPKPTNHNNFLWNIFNFETTGVNERNTAEYKIEVNEGMLLLFPSQQRHFTQINKTDEERYSLAFNLWLKGDMGNDELEKIKL